MRLTRFLIVTLLAGQVLASISLQERQAFSGFVKNVTETSAVQSGTKRSRAHALANSTAANVVSAAPQKNGARWPLSNAALTSQCLGLISIESQRQIARDARWFYSSFSLDQQQSRAPPLNS
jgi:hypothetical protein